MKRRLIVLGFNDTSNLVVILSQRKGETRRRDSKEKKTERDREEEQE